MLHNRSNIQPASFFVMTFFIFALFFPVHTFAGCINCDPSPGSGSSRKTSADYDDNDTVSKTSSRNIDRNIRRLDDDVVDDLFVPVLFGAGLSSITPNFGDPRDGGARKHEGLDMLAPTGTPVLTPTSAVVLRKGTGSSAGRYVTTANPGGERFIYMHLDEIADIDVGEILTKGEVVGYVGDTGNARGGPAHLHFEIEKNRRNIDPYNRITWELSLERKMAYLEEILKENRSKRFSEFLAKEFESVFVYAQVQGVQIPDRVLSKLSNEARGASLGTSDLEIGAKGVAVSALQSVLIDNGFLNIGEPTGYFGPLTKTGLINYQKRYAIKPATGYYGPRTRSVMLTQSSVPKTSKKKIVSASEDDLSLESIIKLFLALEIIAPDKENQAYAVLEGIT